MCEYHFNSMVSMYVCQRRRSLEEHHYVLLLMLMRTDEVMHSGYINNDIAPEQHTYFVFQMLALCVCLVKTLAEILVSPFRRSERGWNLKMKEIDYGAHEGRSRNICLHLHSK